MIIRFLLMFIFIYFLLIFIFIVCSGCNIKPQLADIRPERDVVIASQPAIISIPAASQPAVVHLRMDAPIFNCYGSFWVSLVSVFVAVTVTSILGVILWRKKLM